VVAVDVVSEVDRPVAGRAVEGIGRAQRHVAVIGLPTRPLGADIAVDVDRPGGGRRYRGQLGAAAGDAAEGDRAAAGRGGQGVVAVDVVSEVDRPVARRGIEGIGRAQ